MELELRGRRALVTGSTGDIGLAAARQLAADGAAVVVNGRTPARVDAAVRAVREAAMITYVCSGRASATNGAALRVDGGLVRSIL